MARERDGRVGFELGWHYCKYDEKIEGMPCKKSGCIGSTNSALRVFDQLAVQESMDKSTWSWFSEQAVTYTPPPGCGVEATKSSAESVRKIRNARMCYVLPGNNMYTQHNATM